MAKQITKEELIKQNAEFAERLKIAEERDEVIRKNLSEFLGIFKYPKNSWDKMETKILQWSGIYFEIGKIVDRNAHLETHEELWDKVNELQMKGREDDARFEKLKEMPLIKDKLL